MQIKIIQKSTGKEFIIPAVLRQSILDTVMDKGISIPYACKWGACNACQCKVNKWMEYIDRDLISEALIPVDEDQLLTCVGWVKDEYIQKDWEIEIEIQ